MGTVSAMTNAQFHAALADAAEGVEGTLAAVLPSTGDDLSAAMRHAALGGGKRLRPFLVIESARLFDVSRNPALVVGAALECVHCYSLVHDDLPAMDDDALRRGRPTVHIAFDEATAILAGDALLTLAFELIAGPDAHPNGDVRANLALALARAAGHHGMVGGQALDLAAETMPVTDEAGITAIQSRKTGALIRFACEAGAILADAPSTQRAALVTYAEHLGLAFQIADDLLDVAGTTDMVGKATGKDSDAGKATFVSLFGIDGARSRLQAETNSAVAALDPFGPDADIMRAAARFVMERKS